MNYIDPTGEFADVIVEATVLVGLTVAMAYHYAVKGVTRLGKWYGGILLSESDATEGSENIYEPDDEPCEVPVWPETAEEMDEALGMEGEKVPDKPDTPGRNKTVWQPSDKVRITHEKHPYHKERHKTPHWHLDTPGKPHETFEPGDPIPGY